MTDGRAGSREGVVFVFSGHGCQWTGMALELLDASPLFAERMLACEQALRPHVDWSLIDVLRGRPSAPRLHRVDIVQPTLFAVTVALAELWRACGVRPDAVVGHSQGEIAAAHMAGGLSLEDATAVVARRSRALARLSGEGSMAALSIAPEQLTSCLEPFGGQLELGAVNGPASFAVAGPEAQIVALLETCKAKGVRAGKVAIDYASHSSQIEPLRGELLDLLSTIAPRSGEIPFFSTVTGGPLDTAECGAEHWYRGERQTVQFESVMRALLKQGHRTFIEISPHPVLAAAMQETVDHASDEQADTLVASSLRRGQGEPERFSISLANVFAHGVDFDWEAACQSIGLEGRSIDTEPGGQEGAQLEQRALTAVPTGMVTKGSLAVRIEGLAKAERARAVLDAVAADVASVLGVAALDGAMARQAFKDLGLDSSGVVELRNRLRTTTGLRLPATLVFDHPTPTTLAAYLLDELTGARDVPVARSAAQQLMPISQRDEPIAIVGMSCRFAGGVSSPQELWELLLAGRDAIGDFPADRGWDLDALYDPDPDRTGTTYAREGGFLYDAGEFDAAFFGISPREASAMDPQQRLFLEACWEAFETAGIDARSQKGSQTGVYAGINTLDYNARAWLTPDGLEGYNMTGGIGSVIAGRVSYVLGLHGPALTVDTACSSSLVTLHLASGALRRGECSMALAGGVSVMVTPGLFAAFSRQRALASDGRCKSFAQSADGTGWGEGVGVLLLERLADAQRNGHRVMALVRGSAVNQDGASNGLAAPNGLAQQQVIRQALASAGLSPSEVDAVEAHGTGTRLGDPIESHALLATYGQERSEGRPLWLGSVKSNIGHTQAAAGVAGVVKMVMALRHGTLPKTLHVDEPSREVDWSSGDVSLLTESVDWPLLDRPRRAGVSSYGISGTNAHVIIEEAPCDVEPASPSIPGRGVRPELFSWVLSGRDEAALMAQAARLETFLASSGDLSAEDIGLSLAGRSTFEHRAVVLGGDYEQLRGGLIALARGDATTKVVQGVARSSATRLAFMFTGQGAQRVGMGAELYRSQPVFAAAFDEVCLYMDPHLGRSLREVVLETQYDAGNPASNRSLLDDTLFTQAGLFALEVALYRQVEAWGVKPDFVMGHSIGELAAAFVADVYSLEDACRLVAARGRLMADLPAGGAMVAVQASEHEIAETLLDLEGRVALAGINGPSSVVISGDEEPVLRAAAVWEGRGRKTRRLRVSHAFHSPRMDGMLDEFRRVAESMSFNEPSIPLVSNVTGEALSQELCTAEYWVRHIREPVRFADSVNWLRRNGVGSFLELGPDGVLSGMASESVGGDLESDGQLDAPVVAVPLMRSGRPETLALHSAVAQIWACGAHVTWAAMSEGLDAQRVELPTYAFQRERYWLDLPRGCWLQEGQVLSAQDTLDGWRYRVRWKPSTGEARGTLSGLWLLVIPSTAANDRTVADVIDRLKAHGARVLPIEVDMAGAERQRLSEQLSEAVAGLPASPGEPSSTTGQTAPPLVAGVLSMLALDETRHDSGSSTPCGFVGTLALMQALGDAQQWAPLWIATRGAVSVGPSDRLEHPLQGMAWGLGRVMRLENPGRWGGLIDLPAEDDEHSLDLLCGQLASEDGEDEVAIRAAGIFLRRLVRASESVDLLAESWAPPGTVLVTGGTGALGGHLSRRLAREGAQHILLAARRGRDAPGARDLEDELVALGARVTVAACDIADREQLRELLATVPEDQPLSAVFHVAGVLDDELIDELPFERAVSVLRPKVDAAWHLHELTEHLALRTFVMFSSISATLGGGGQGAYAAGNAFLDALADYRRARGLPATAVAWGAWSGGGMAVGVGDHMHRRGVGEMAVEPALTALWQILERDETHTMVADVDWERYAQLFASARKYPSIGDLPEVRRSLKADGEARSGGESRGSLAARLGDVPPAEHERVALELVQTQAAIVLGHPSPDAVHPQRVFRELGFDSLSGVELRNRLAVTTGVQLASTLVFDYPTPTALAKHLLSQVGGVRMSAPTVVAAGATDEPIAIVGMGCRFPGSANSPERLWNLLISAADGISPFPTDRGWDLTGIYDPDPEHPGTIYTREGGFLHDACEFDAAFFGIGPREALAMSPQQRLLLEVCWETLEKATIDPRSLQGSATGVFMGESFSDYSTGQFGSTPEDVKVYLGTGNSGSVVSGRVAYTLGLEGPAVTVNTACSSSLVALHLASASLRAGECGLALVGGVTVMATPAVFLDFSRQRGSAPDGRSKSFSDGADGAGWGEGVGVVALERLSDAERNGHNVLAVVRSSAVNQDGASNGLTAPNGPAQQRVILQALANAGLSSGDVDAVEAHGTGTRLGDPIEAQALLATYGQDRDHGPLWLGSLKSNIGHTQAAAGIAGVIKMVMALQHERLPRTLHVEEPSSQVDWSSGAVSLLIEETPWLRNGRPRRAGVSSFGISGTNAHVILEEPSSAQAAQAHSSQPDASASRARVVPWIVSARSERALRAQAKRLAAQAREDSASLADIGFSLASRAGLEYRAVVLGAQREALLGGLEALAEGHPAPDALEGLAVAGRGPIAFLFTGQGAQHAGMGAGLYEEFPVFRRALDEACELLDGHLGCSLRELMFAQPESAQALKLDETVFTQTSLFALEVALFRLLESWSVRPGYLIGHSVGELAAAHAAGVLSLSDACMLVAARGRLMSALPEGGAMVAVQASEPEMLESISELRGEAALAAVNGPDSVVISGDEDTVLEVAKGWSERGRKTRRLRVSHAFHSARMDGMLEQFAEVAERVSFAEPSIPVVSNLTGGVVGAGELCSADYWVRHVRETVRFADGVLWLQRQGVKSFLELGPDGVLSAMVQDCLRNTSATRHPVGAHSDGDRLDELAGEAAAIVAVPVMRSGREELATALAALAATWVVGADIEWARLFDESGALRVELPTYAFQRERFWLDSMERGIADAEAVGQASAGHPLLGAAVALAEEKGWLFTGRLSLTDHPWLADHVVLGSVLLPGTAFLELALYAGGQLGCEVVSELALQSPLVLPDDGAVQLQVKVGAANDAGARSLSVYSCAECPPGGTLASEAQWICHAVGSLAPPDPDRQFVPAALEDGMWPPAGAESVPVEDVYDRLAESGLDYGPIFQGLTGAWRRDREIFAEVALPDAELDQAGSFGLHPALLDAALHATALITPAHGEPSDADSSKDARPTGVKLPFCWNDVTLLTAGASVLRVHISPTGGDSVSIVVADESCRPLASVGSLVTRSASAAGIAGVTSAQDGLFHLDWITMPRDSPQTEMVRRSRWAFIGAEALAPDLGSTLQLDSHAELRSLSDAIGSGQTDPPDLVLLDCRTFGQPLPSGARVATVRALGGIQEWLADDRLKDSQLAILTCGAVATQAGEDVPDLAAAAVWGLVRSAQAENPQRLVLVDVDGEQSSWQALAAAPMDGESQYAIRRGELLVARLVRAGSDTGLTPPAGALEWRLDAGGANTFEGLALVACPEMSHPLEPEEIRVGVRAAGVNFKDVLIALGVYPGNATIGNEAAGVVLEVGSGVEDLAPGDRVTGLFSGAFGSLAITDSRLVARVPDTWSFAQAASMPLVFLTAYYALVDLADVQQHERLLVHSAAGGVGMAAVQLARHLGVEAFGTASSEKWRVLEQWGLDTTHIGSSRDLSFRKGFLDETSSEGMDIVLNSLTGEFIDASLELLPRGGRFVEMGKTDTRDPEKVAAEHPGVAYRAFDLMEAGPDRIKEMFAILMDLFERDVLKLAPIRAWDMRRAPEALRFMSQARHVGKIVLTRAARDFDPHGTMLITGGTGGLGSLLARHLVADHGVRHLLLASRAGEAAAGVEQLRRELADLGASVQIASCDVSNREQLEALIGSIAESHPLRGVVHAAGVLDDGVIDSLTPERVERVLAPKLDAAWHLHELTAHRDLDAFVLFSSVAATLGGPGQGNYAAANSFLEALAASRCAQGLPAVAMAWGPWEQTTGMTSELGRADLGRMASSGMLTLSSEQGLALFDAACAGDQALAVLARLDSTALRARARSDELPSVLGNLIRKPVRQEGAPKGGASSLAAQFAGASKAERGRIVLEFVRTQTAAVLGHASSDALDSSRTFKDLGFDSLAAVELRNRLGASTDLQLPATLVFDYPMLGALAAHICDELSAATTEPTRSVETGLDELALTLSSMSAEDAQRTGMAARLQHILSGWSAPEATGEDAAEEDLSMAADEEIFELIDREFGVS